jgi:DNA-binding transcriptional LysR family regulator
MMDPGWPIGFAMARWAGGVVPRSAANLPFTGGPFSASGIRQPASAAVVIPDLRAVLATLVAGAGYSVLPSYLCADEIAAGPLYDKVGLGEHGGRRRCR